MQHFYFFFLMMMLNLILAEVARTGDGRKGAMAFAYFWFVATMLATVLLMLS